MATVCMRWLADRIEWALLVGTKWIDYDKAAS